MKPHMKAAVLYGREDVRIEQVEVPVPGPGEILLRTKAALTCGTDVKVFRRGYHARMIQPPALFGHEVAGVVEAVGEGVDSLAPGTRVAVANSAPCGECPACAADRPNLCEDLLFWNGAYAEFARIPARIVRTNVLRLSSEVGFREAALVEPLACVVRGIEDCGIRSGLTVAVIGAGPIGLMLVRLAVLRGARLVVVGRNAGRLQAARALGAAEALALRAGEDPAERIRAVCDRGGPEVVIEAVGLPHTADAAIRAVGRGGLVNLFAGCPADARVCVDAQRLHYQELTVRSTFHHTPKSLRQALQLIAERRLDARAFITAEATLDELPSVLVSLARGGEGLKTAILTGVDEGPGAAAAGV